ncbi:DNA repair helicase XPB [Singulisphaera acidiphila]|uniref:DNA 3'-5' helicase n=1 Tax=Singulisphaera acidiphila (strain ATCC BAA-1392 / DSM 18658 / VKM B-2454 / MOB10) TaxID=886293 RepID=L0DM27_SINAD|nr:DNA repair helicase XPB [Singulisphaera acidiphila]AGA30429.1 DNA/RNA helicase, superfamily II [Singulisphaera acidiphila DSM 18658]
MQYNPSNPLIVQGDRTVLLEVDNPLHAEARDAIAPFAELEKSPEHIHTYRLTSLSLWNAAAAGMTADAMIDALGVYSKFPLPPNLGTDLRELVSRYGRVTLRRIDGVLRMVTADQALLEELARQKGVRDFLGERIDATSFVIDDAFRGMLKQALIGVGYPAEDLAGYAEGADLAVEIREIARSGLPFKVRDYQRGAVDAFHAGGDARGGSGVVVLPCGAGKTIVGLTALAALKKNTLVLTTSTTAVEQWKREILDKTDLDDSMVATYTGDSKAIAPVTLATYQIVTYRPKKDGDFPHFSLFNQRDWGLIIYDEVHLLPAPVFRVTADIQARRRLGLTATLVREDNREEDVFSLIGPKKFDVPWRVLESKGWIAEAQCHEVRLGLPGDARMEYAVAEWRDKFRLASENPSKDDLVALLLDEHDGPDDRVLVIGQYLKQLRRIAARFDVPLITGQTSNSEREDLYGRFRRGDIRRLVLSKVGNFAIDLPDANVMIQVSGTFGSRQEEAQRLGRILRPKEGEVPASFYSLVTRDTREMDFAHHRQLFLTEQGYSYEILDESDIVARASTASKS